MKKKRLEPWKGQNEKEKEKKVPFVDLTQSKMGE
jgi:hypothetical protein